MKKSSFRKNGEKGGRPKSSTYSTKFIVKDSNTVILTENQYNNLINRYGIELIRIALSILDDWLENSPLGFKYKGKNNYAHFRADGWLINEAKSTTQQI